MGTKRHLGTASHLSWTEKCKDRSVRVEWWSGRNLLMKELKCQPNDFELESISFRQTTLVEVDHGRTKSKVTNPDGKRKSNNS